MKKYFDSVQDRAGNALQGASVAVLNYPALTPATIFTGNGVGLIAGNVVTTDVRGYFEFYAADGHYTLSISGTGITPQTVNDVLIEDPADANPSVVSTLLATLGITLSTLTLGSVLFAGTAGAVSQDNANLFWDNTAKRLGIGNAAPTTTLDVTGTCKISGTLTVNGVSVNISNTTPTLFLTDSGWGSFANLQAGVNSGGTGIGNFLMFGVPTGKGFTFAVNNVSKASIDSTGIFTVSTSVVTPIIQSATTIQLNTNNSPAVGWTILSGGDIVPNTNASYAIGNVALTLFPSKVFTPIIDSGVGSLTLKGAGTSMLTISSTDIQWNRANVALGGGAAPTVGTIGGAGPAAAAQRNWLRFIESDGTASFIPVWR